MGYFEIPVVEGEVYPPSVVVRTPASAVVGGRLRVNAIVQDINEQLEEKYRGIDSVEFWFEQQSTSANMFEVEVWGEAGVARTIDLWCYRGEDVGVHDDGIETYLVWVSTGDIIAGTEYGENIIHVQYSVSSSHSAAEVRTALLEALSASESFVTSEITDSRLYVSSDNSFGVLVKVSGVTLPARQDTKLELVAIARGARGDRAIFRLTDEHANTYDVELIFSLFDSITDAMIYAIGEVNAQRDGQEPIQYSKLSSVILRVFCDEFFALTILPDLDERSSLLLTTVLRTPIQGAEYLVISEGEAVEAEKFSYGVVLVGVKETEELLLRLENSEGEVKFEGVFTGDGAEEVLEAVQVALSGHVIFETGAIEVINGKQRMRIKALEYGEYFLTASVVELPGVNCESRAISAGSTNRVIFKGEQGEDGIWYGEQELKVGSYVAGEELQLYCKAVGKKPYKRERREGPYSITLISGEDPPIILAEPYCTHKLNADETGVIPSTGTPPTKPWGDIELWVKVAAMTVVTGKCKYRQVGQAVWQEEDFAENASIIPITYLAGTVSGDEPEILVEYYLSLVDEVGNKAIYPALAEGISQVTLARAKTGGFLPRSPAARMNSGDLQKYYYQFKVLPSKNPPSISHEPPTVPQYESSSIYMECRCESDSRVVACTVYFKTHKAIKVQHPYSPAPGGWVTAPLEMVVEGDGRVWEGYISSAYLALGGFQYYFEATDLFGNVGTSKQKDPEEGESEYSWAVFPISTLFPVAIKEVFTYIDPVVTAIGIILDTLAVVLDVIAFFAIVAVDAAETVVYALMVLLRSVKNLLLDALRAGLYAFFYIDPGLENWAVKYEEFPLADGYLKVNKPQFPKGSGMGGFYAAMEQTAGVKQSFWAGTREAITKAAYDSNSLLGEVYYKRGDVSVSAPQISGDAHAAGMFLVAGADSFPDITPLLETLAKLFDLTSFQELADKLKEFTPPADVGYNIPVSYTPDWVSTNLLDIFPILHEAERYADILMAYLESSLGYAKMIRELVDILKEKAKILKELSEQIGAFVELIEAFLDSGKLLFLWVSSVVKPPIDEVGDFGPDAPSSVRALDRIIYNARAAKDMPFSADSFVVGLCLVAGISNVKKFKDFLGGDDNIFANTIEQIKAPFGEEGEYAAAWEGIKDAYDSATQPVQDVITSLKSEAAAGENDEAAERYFSGNESGYVPPETPPAVPVMGGEPYYLFNPAEIAGEYTETWVEIVLTSNQTLLEPFLLDIDNGDQFSADRIAMQNKAGGGSEWEYKFSVYTEVPGIHTFSLYKHENDKDGNIDYDNPREMYQYITAEFVQELIIII